jgi:hypothetical protein
MRVASRRQRYETISIIAFETLRLSIEIRTGRRKSTGPPQQDGETEFFWRRIEIRDSLSYF